MPVPLTHNPMEASEHVPPVTLFYYLLDAMTLTRGERSHLQICAHCQSVLEELEAVTRREGISPAA